MTKKTMKVQGNPKTLVINTAPQGQKNKPVNTRRESSSAGRMITAPVSVGRVVTTKASKAITTTDTDYLDASSVSKGAVTGSVIATIDMAPGSWPDTHAARMAKLYERYRFTALEVVVSSRAPTNTAGGYLAGFDIDPERVIGGDARRSVRSLVGSKSAPYWLSQSFKLKPDSQWRYTLRKNETQEARWLSYGTFYLVVDQPPSNFEGDLVLTLEVTYSIQFDSPIIGTAGEGSIRSFSLTGGQKEVINDGVANGLAVYASAGTKGTVDWTNFWNQAHYANVYLCHPSIAPADPITMRQNSGEVDEINYVRIMQTSNQSEGIVFFKDYASAIAAGSNPSRDARKMIEFLDADDKHPDVIELPTFTLVEVSGK